MDEPIGRPYLPRGTLLLLQILMIQNHYDHVKSFFEAIDYDPQIGYTLEFALIELIHARAGAILDATLRDAANNTAFKSLIKHGPVWHSAMLQRALQQVTKKG